MDTAARITSGANQARPDWTTTEKPGRVAKSHACRRCAPAPFGVPSLPDFRAGEAAARERASPDLQERRT